MLNLSALAGGIVVMLTHLSSVATVMSLQKVPLRAHNVQPPTPVHINTSPRLNRLIVGKSEVTIRQPMGKCRAKPAMQDITAPMTTLPTILAQLVTGLYQRWSTVTNALLATNAPIPTCLL